MQKKTQRAGSVGDCIIFSTADWKEPYWTNKQHMARRLAARGWRVLYIESVGLRAPAIGSAKDWKRAGRRLLRGLYDLIMGPRMVEPSLWVLSPLSVPPPLQSAIFTALNRLTLNRPARLFLRDRGSQRPLLWTYHPLMLQAAEEIAEGILVYHCVDDIAAMPRVNAPAFHSAEERLLRRADIVFATSRPLFQKSLTLNPNSHFFPNVADTEYFGRAFDAVPILDLLQGIPRPRLGFHGVLSDFKIDFSLIEQLSLLRPDWHIVMIGEERAGQNDPTLGRLRLRPNIHFLGYLPYGKLADYLRGIDIGLMPLRVNAYTQSMFPMKLYEYLAAGVPIVSTPGPFAEGVNHLLVAENATTMVAAIQTQLASGRLTAAQALSAVGENTWDTRLSRMLDLIEPIQTDQQRQRE